VNAALPVLQALVLLAVGGFVLLPLLQRRGERVPPEADTANRARSIGERKHRLFRQLVELDFDKDSGKLSAEDHARMREETMNEVVAVMAEEERLGLALAKPSPAGPESPAAVPAAAASDRAERMVEEMKKRQEASGAGVA
jgi:cytochrome c-type biogenesis protein CcmI